MFEKDTAPISCPYCGSIENNGLTCKWCGNKITEEYESEEQPMNVELRFTGLTPELALRLIKVVNESGEQPDIDIPATPVRNTSPAAASAFAPAAYQMPNTPASGTMYGTAPISAPQNTSAPMYQQTPAAVPTAAPTAPPPQYDVEMLGRAAAPLAAAGKRQELYNLLQSFGVQSINELPKERYGEMAMALRGMGAQI